MEESDDGAEEHNATQRAMLFEAHMRLQQENGSFNCRFGCTPSFPTKERLNTHMRKSHGWEECYPKLGNGHKKPPKLKDWSSDWEQWSSTVQDVQARKKRKGKGKIEESSTLTSDSPRKRKEKKNSLLVSFDMSMPREDLKVRAEEFAKSAIMEKKEDAQPMMALPLVCRIFTPEPEMNGFDQEYLNYMERGLVSGPLFTWLQFKKGLEAVQSSDARQEAMQLSCLFASEDIREEFKFYVDEIFSGVVKFVKEFQEHRLREATLAKNRGSIEERQIAFVKGCLLQYDALRGCSETASPSDRKNCVDVDDLERSLVNEKCEPEKELCDLLTRGLTLPCKHVPHVELLPCYLPMLFNDTTQMDTACFDACIKFVIECKGGMPEGVYLIDPFVWADNLSSEKKHCFWKNVQFNSSSLICLPTLKSNHWSLVLISLIDSKIYELDSIERTNPNRFMVVKKDLKTMFGSCGTAGQDLKKFAWKRPMVPKQGSTLLCGWYTIFFFAHVAFRSGSLDGKFDEIFADNDFESWKMGILESLKLFINGISL